MTRLIHRPREGRAATPDTPVEFQRGVVTYHDLEKGYGKIHSDGIEYFFHITACSGRFRRLAEGTPVTFRGGETAKGPRAFEVLPDSAPRSEEMEAADQRGNR